MLKNGIYRTIEAGEVVDEHGGFKIKHYIFWFLVFHYEKKFVGMYGSSNKEYFDPYRKNQYELKGEITRTENSYITFYIFNVVTGVKILFDGHLSGEKLYLEYHHEDKPEKIYVDVFEYVNLGDEK